MMGVQYHQALDQYKELDKEGKDTLKRTIAAPLEEVEWPKNEMPKFHKKRNLKPICVNYDTKVTLYMTNYMPIDPREVIKIDLGDTSLHYCWHSERKMYI